MKNTINKSEVFKAAWKYKKENNWTLSAALKVAWSEAKEGRNNSVDALASLVGGNFYSAYLLNGFHVTMFQYENDWYLFDADNSYIHTSMTNGSKYDKEATDKGYRNDVALFKAEGNKMIFKA